MKTEKWNLIAEKIVERLSRDRVLYPEEINDVYVRCFDKFSGKLRPCEELSWTLVDSSGFAWAGRVYESSGQSNPFGYGGEFATGFWWYFKERVCGKLLGEFVRHHEAHEQVCREFANWEDRFEHRAALDKRRRKEERDLQIEKSKRVCGGKRFVSLYRFFDKNDRLLYVGISYSAIARMAQHAQSKSWFGEVARSTIENFGDRQMALREEARVIREEKPHYNITYNRTLAVRTSELEEAVA